MIAINDKRKRYEAIIRALLAKTTERGCTEAEAMEAAAKAKELMDRFEIDELSDEEIIEEGAVRRDWIPQDMTEVTMAAFIFEGIRQFTDTKVMWAPLFKGQKRKPVAIVGLKSDVDFAMHLVASLCQFGKTGAMTVPARRRRRYMAGYGLRVGARLKDVAAARKAAQTSGSRALVVVDIKAKAIDAFLVNLEIVKTRGRRIVVDDSSYRAGVARADKATFDRPIDGGHKRLS